MDSFLETGKLNCEQAANDARDTRQAVREETFHVAVSEMRARGGVQGRAREVRRLWRTAAGLRPSRT